MNGKSGAEKENRRQNQILIVKSKHGFSIVWKQVEGKRKIRNCVSIRMTIFTNPKNPAENKLQSVRLSMSDQKLLPREREKKRTLGRSRVMGRNFWAKLSAKRIACNGTRARSSGSSETLVPPFLGPISFFAFSPPRPPPPLCSSLLSLSSSFEQPH